MRKRRTGIVLAGAVMLLLIVLGMYAGIGFYYRTHFLEHATINGTDVSDLTAEEAKESLAASVENYTLTVKTREGKTETIRGEDIRYRLVADQEIQSFLDQQNAMAWLPKYFGSGDAYTMEVSTSYDKALLQHVEAKLDCLKTDAVTAPKDDILHYRPGSMSSSRRKREILWISRRWTKHCRRLLSRAIQRWIWMRAAAMPHRQSGPQTAV